MFSQHVDLFHTSSSSYAYLNGHITDFYDYNKPLVDGNDYLPIIYAIFAIWNLPLKLFGLTHNVAATGVMLSIPELIWTKLLLVIFYFASAFVIYKISKQITNNVDNSKIVSIIFATSPIAIFAVFIFGQYDIIGVFFTMLGFYYYVKNDYLKFSIFFSFAISLKFFPLLIFIPLILLVEKRILHILKYGIISLSATILQIITYLR
jgi:Gpi18-like mannosyltransferase